MKNIKIIGAGQLGSRHLQALKAINYPCKIEVVDPCIESLKLAKSRYLTMEGSDHHKVYYNTNVSIYGETDLAIIATTSSIRRQAIINLLSHCNVRYLILEKILFHNESDYFHISKRLKESVDCTWVNCCMREMPFYNSIRSFFKSKPLRYTVSGGQFGLITNSIHYIDHLIYLTGCHDFIVNTDHLLPRLTPSKRKNYFEVNGLLVANFKDGSQASIQCWPQGNQPVQIDLYNETHRVISKESMNKAWISSIDSNWEWKKKDAKIPYQSELTNSVVQSIFSTSKCRLPEYEESMKTHINLLEPIKKYIIKHKFNVSCDYPFT